MNIKPRDYQCFEILDEIEKIQSVDNKVEQFQVKFGDHTPLLRILKMGYCDTIVSMLPEGEPPFNKEEIDGPNRASLWSYIQTFPIIVRSAQSAKMRMLQIERVFIEMLEAVDVKEAEMICLAKDKRLQERWPSITVDLVKRAFPNLNIVSNDYVEPEPEELSVKQRAAQMKAEAAEIKAKIKEMNARAKELMDRAKELAAGGVE